ncbi:hypothetical protein OAH36_04435, partial [Verrucomicrobia bacterium]|nr:hypothetical protein [Verrucomicrobiota bacterium]
KRSRRIGLVGSRVNGRVFGELQGGSSYWFVWVPAALGRGKRLKSLLLVGGQTGGAVEFECSI